MTIGIAVLAVALVVGVAVGLLARARAGRWRRARPAVLAAGDLGAELGDRATLVQFSSSFCAPCRATRQTLAAVAETVPGVRHVEVDAESRLDLVRRLGVVRTPTTLLLDRTGRVRQRASGQPRREQVLAALAAVLPE